MQKNDLTFTFFISYDIRILMSKNANLDRLYHNNSPLKIFVSVVIQTTGENGLNSGFWAIKFLFYFKRFKYSMMGITKPQKQ